MKFVILAPNFENITIKVLYFDPEMESENPEPRPMYWDLLSENDKRSYLFLRQTLASPTCKNRRNRSAQTFSEILEGIKTYVVRGDEKGDHDRSLVCGICWLNDKIAINTRQLRLILSKCKSSINGSFQQLGYGTIPTGADSSAELVKYFPELENNFPQLRQWTVRQIIPQAAVVPAKLSDLITQSYAPTQGQPQQLQQIPAQQVQSSPVNLIQIPSQQQAIPIQASQVLPTINIQVQRQPLQPSEKPVVSPLLQ